jgi:hypothetical protein
MPLDDSAGAMRAKTNVARRHALAQRAQALAQRERAIEQRAAELAAVEAAQREVRLQGDRVRCTRCNSVWRTEAVREATRRHCGCLLCGGRLVSVADD